MIERRQGKERKEKRRGKRKGGRWGKILRLKTRVRGKRGGVERGRESTAPSVCQHLGCAERRLTDTELWTLWATCQPCA